MNLYLHSAALSVRLAVQRKVAFILRKKLRHGRVLLNKKTHNKTKNSYGKQSPNYFVKQTKTSRSTVFALKGPILSENGANMVRNVFLIFIHDKLCINEVKIKLTQTTTYLFKC